MRRSRADPLYAWFGRNEAVVGNVLRDAEQNPTLREVSDLRFGVPLGTIFASLAGGLTEKQRAALAVAMSYYTWRTLARQAELAAPAAVDLMTTSVLGADR